jgi:pyruvate dehydrogenase E1 component alpha subunit
LYRGKDEVEHWKERDPIVTFTQRCLTADALTEDDVAAIRRAAEEELADAVAYAEAGTWEPVEDLARDVMTTLAAEAI